VALPLSIAVEIEPYTTILPRCSLLIEDFAASISAMNSTTSPTLSLLTVPLKFTCTTPRATRALHFRIRRLTAQRIELGVHCGKVALLLGDQRADPGTQYPRGLQAALHSSAHPRAEHHAADDFGGITKLERQCDTAGVEGTSVDMEHHCRRYCRPTLGRAQDSVNRAMPGPASGNPTSAELYFSVLPANYTSLAG
jgi:hypothetical protein